ncbi:Uncharacterised protein [Mycobacteroides abscessus subsp. massiliense]|nr:Uncharacterised protein [Mycobacteroides abscessus subsp. massiliense]
MYMMHTHCFIYYTQNTLMYEKLMCKLKQMAN